MAEDPRARLLAARLYLCVGDRPDLLEVVAAALRGGVDLVQLRDKRLEAADEIARTEELADLVRGHGALLATNDRADVARAVGADVLHLGQRDLPPAVAREVAPGALLGRSTHDAEQAAAADADPLVDYFCVGPVWATPTKPGRPAVGVDLVRAVAARRPATPWFAIGGVEPGERLQQLVDAGAERVVVVRAVADAPDPEAAARALRAQLPA